MLKKNQKRAVRNNPTGAMETTWLAYLAPEGHRTR